MVKLKIISVESKSGATGNFVRANTDQGWLSAFEEPAKGLILQSIGKELECEVTEKVSGDKTYRNIKSASLVNETNPGVTDVQATKTEVHIDNKFTTMYVSYAKDVFNAIKPEGDHSHETLTNNMTCAINLVKQARDAFS